MTVLHMSHLLWVFEPVPGTCDNMTLNNNKGTPATWRTYSDLSLDEAGDVIAGVKHGQCPHDVLLQPIPVLHDLLLGAA